MIRTADRFSVAYRVRVEDGRSIEDHVADIAVEQTVEIPHDCIPQSHHEQGLIGTAEDIQPLDTQGRRFRVVISYRSDITAYSVPQLLNVLFGNISLKNCIRIEDIRFSESLHQAFPGPQWGVAGIRKQLGIYGRPLACSALKPMGLPADQLAQMATRLVAGGIDIIKEDHGIGDQPFHPFRERVEQCYEAIQRANESAGGRTLYFPMVSGRFEQIEEQVRFAATLGVRGVLVAPMLVGPDTVRYLADTYGLMIMGHPALTGTHFHDRDHGISPAVLLGTLFRLIGVDISVFPNCGGRFPFTEEDCRELAGALRREERAWHPAWPCPAGGMSPERLDTMAAMYGADTVFLVGGALMRQPGDLSAATATFMDRIRAVFPEKVVDPAPAGSSCEVSPAGSSCEVSPAGSHTDREHDGIFRFEDFRWSDRTMEDYKAAGDGDFRGITRGELVGGFGESTAFDVRYFEIEPGGYSSLERHVHEHVIIGVRGSGILVKGEQRHEFGVNDIGYVKPSEPHQLRNEGTEPFGFYCIVDHRRDRPVPVKGPGT